MGMLVKPTIIGILCLILLAGTAAAIDLSPSTISSSATGWLVANDGLDSSTITVYALEPGTPPIPVSNAQVAFTLAPDSIALGTITPASVNTLSDGKATATFSTKKKSGTATILATISFADGMTTPVQKSLILNIDHDTPQTATFDGPAELAVGSVTQVNVTVTDRWGNRVDNKNTAETIILTMVDEGGAGLWGGADYWPQGSYSTDVEGNVTAPLRISTTVKKNYIQMTRIGAMIIDPDTHIDGTAGSGTVPFFLSQSAPIPGSLLPADGLPENAVEVYYTVTDQFNNPITGATLTFDSSDGYGATAPTNTWGVVRISFGPKDTIGTYTLRATTPGNSTILCRDTGTIGYCSQSVEYYNNDPVDLIFMANPQAMPSRDVKDSAKTYLRARVVDEKGNPVIGEEVEFSFDEPTYPGGPYTETVPPALSRTTDLVGGLEGYATSEFSPGAFAKKGEPGWIALATGRTVLRATWTNKAGTITKNRDVTVEWKNYPYISPDSFGNCDLVQVGDSVNITIQIAGDGSALDPYPIDVILLNDRSGSMLQGGEPDRMVSAKAANSLFFSQLTQDKDKVGLVSFAAAGWGKLAPDYVPATNTWSWTHVYSSGYWVKADTQGPYSNPFKTQWDTVDCPGCLYGITTSTAYSFASPHHQYVVANYNGGVAVDYTSGNYNIDLPFGYHTQAEVDAALDSIVPNGNTPTREGIYRAVNLLPPAEPGRVRAIILLTDGEYNTGKNPEGQDHTDTFTAGDLAKTDNVLTYAFDRGIKVYVIGLSVSSTYAEILQRYADTTEGKYFNANNPSELDGIYSAIAGDLRETAGGNVYTALDFGTVKINDDPTMDIRNYMDYVTDVHIPARSTDSTYINKTNVSKTGVYHQLYHLSRDDRDAWDARAMAFDVGTIKLNETWRATFRLKLTQAGNIEMFGPDSSTITFVGSDGGVQTSFIPPMTCHVKQNIVNIGFGSRTLSVDNLSFVDVGSPTPNIWAIKWNTTYDGDKTVEEAILYRPVGGAQWQTVPGGLVFISNKVVEHQEHESISIADTSLWSPGKCYNLQIVAGAIDAKPSRTDSIERCIAPLEETIYIKLD